MENSKFLSVAEIDFDKFKSYKQNRSVSEKNVQSKIESIKRIGFVGNILCSLDDYEKDGVFTVIDGQHRLVALMRLGYTSIPVQLVSGDSSNLISILNKSQIKWITEDFVKMYAEQGIECYKEIILLSSKYKLPLSISINICTGITSCGKDMEGVKSGKEFKLNPYRFDIARIISEIDDVPYSKTMFFIRSFLKMYEKATPKQIEMVVDSLPRIKRQVSSNDYLVVFENIINKRSSKKISLIAR